MRVLVVCGVTLLLSKVDGFDLLMAEVLVQFSLMRFELIEGETERRPDRSLEINCANSTCYPVTASINWSRLASNRGCLCMQRLSFNAQCN